MASEARLLTERGRAARAGGRLRAPDLHTERLRLNMGPSHPATHGTVKFMIVLDGENIVDLDIQVGYLHRGFEKECESGHLVPGDPLHGPPQLQTPRCWPTSATASSVEKLLSAGDPGALPVAARDGRRAPPASPTTSRAAARAAWSSQAMTPFLYGIEARELTWDLLEMTLRRAGHLELHPHRRREARHAQPPSRPSAATRIVEDPLAAASTSTTSSPATGSSWTG